MGVNWSLLQPVDIGGMFAQGYERGQQMVERERAKSALAAFSANPMDPQAQNALAAVSPEFAMKLAMSKQELAMKQAEKERIGAYFSQPDIGAARKQALQAGEIDVAKELASMDDDTRKRAIDEAKAAAPFAYEALQFKTPEERRAYGQSVAPQLAAIGITPDELANFDWSDAALNGIINIGQTLEQRREMDRVKWHTDPYGGSFPVDYWGRDVREGQPGSGGATARPVGAPPAAPPEATAEMGGIKYVPVPGAKQTSGYRSAADNKRVDGVSNSYHLSDRARDFVPGPGMTMAELHAEMKAANPHLDVINEGDHVHIEPKEGGARSPVLQAEDIRAKAHAAIAKGANPEEVRARAAAMGVSL